MKVKCSGKWKYSVGTNFQRYFWEEFERSPDIELVGIEDYSDLAFGIRENTRVSVYLDRNDPHALTQDLDVDALVDPKLLRMSMKEYGVAEETLIPSIVWQNRNRKIAYDKFVGSFDVYSPAFFNSVYSKFVSKLENTELYVIPHHLPEEMYCFSGAKSIDAIFSGRISRWYPYRKRYSGTLRKNKEINSLILPQSGAEMKENSKTTKQWDEQLIEYTNNLKKSKIILVDGGIFNYPVKKYIEAMACGCLVLGPVPVYGEELGYVDGETMVEVDLNDFKEKLDYYLKNDSERKRIISNAYTLYTENYTCKKLVEKLLKKFN